MNATFESNKNTNRLPIIKGPKPLPKSSEKLYNENTFPLLRGLLTFIKITFILGGVNAINSPVNAAYVNSKDSLLGGTFINSTVGITPRTVETPQKKGKNFGFYLYSLSPINPPNKELSNAIPPTRVIASVAVPLSY